MVLLVGNAEPEPQFFEYERRKLGKLEMLAVGLAKLVSQQKLGFLFEVVFLELELVVEFVQRLDASA